MTIFVALLATIALVSTSLAFPARFLHALASESSNNLTINFDSPQGSYQCSAQYGDICVIGDFTSVPGIVISITNNLGVTIFSRSGNLNQTQGKTFTIYANESGSSVLGAVPDAPIPTTTSNSAMVANFWGMLSNLRDAQGTIYAVNLADGSAATTLAPFQIGQNQLTVMFKQPAQSFGFPLSVIAKTSLLIAFIPPATPADAPGVVIYTTYGSTTTPPPTHHHHHRYY